jgi:TPR repeat protein
MDGYSFLRFGDFYYEGIYEKQSYSEAYNQYKIASEAPETNSVIQAHAYFNMGYIMALGLGRKKNLTLAHSHFNSSLSKHPFFPGINADILLTLT